MKYPLEKLDNCKRFKKYRIIDLNKFLPNSLFHGRFYIGYIFCIVYVHDLSAVYVLNVLHFKDEDG